MTLSDNSKLRVGLLMDSLTLPAWAYEMLVTVQHSAYAEVKLIVLNDSEEPKRRSLFARVVRNWGIILYLAYCKLEDRVFAPVPNAFEPRNAAELLRDVPVIRAKPRRSKHSDRLEDDDIEKISQYHIDVFVRLGFRILRGRILQAARYGVWSYHHGDNTVNRGVPAGFWEVLEGHPVTGSILQILTEDLDNGTVLCRSFSATDHLSVNRNRNTYYWKSASFLPRKLKELQALGREEFFRRLGSCNRLNFYSRRLYVAPRNWEFVALLSKHLVRYGKLKVRNALFPDQWVLLYDLRDGLSESLWRFKRIVPPRDRFWADPHVVHRDGTYYIFVEEFLYRQGKARISLIEMDGKGNYTQPQPVLERPYHLSYPFVFEWNGDWYMIPETSANHTVEVYKCVAFPNRWEFCLTLIENITAVDATPFFDGRKWWLFANVTEQPGASICDELFLFFADTPLSTSWTAHATNPVVSDVRSSRPAGRIFEHGGHLYRPSQNSEGEYGYGLKLNRIVTLSETEYREEEVSSIEPRWARDIRGIHTLSHAQELTVVDARLRRLAYPIRGKRYSTSS